MYKFKLSETEPGGPHLPLIAAAGRLFLGLIFVLSGLDKVVDPAGTQAFMASVGLPVPFMTYLATVATELIGGGLLIVGWQTRIAAAAMATFTMAAAVLFHSNFENTNNYLHFLKNVSITGGLLQVVAFGAGAFSVGGRIRRAAR